MTLLQSTSGRKLRRDHPICAYVGPNGGGKSCAAVWDTLPTLEAGRPVLSTVRLLDYDNPRPCDDPECSSPFHETHMAAHPLWVPFTKWEQLMEWRFGDVLMDEVTGVASSRETHSMPGEVSNMLNQLRRGDVVVRWTAPSWKRADIIIRECTQAVVSCRGFLPRSFESAPGEPERIWKQKRLFAWQTFDAYAFEDFTAGARERLKPLGRDFHWGPSSPAFAAYDTYEPVLSIGTVNAVGRCMTCGGRRSAPSCSCPDRPVRRSRSAIAGGPRVAGSASAGHECGPDVAASDGDEPLGLSA